MKAKLTAVRAMDDMRASLDYIRSKTRRTRSDTALHGYESALKQLVEDTDLANAKTKQFCQELEHMDSFCMQRDYAYGGSSRRKLYAKAYNSKVRAGRELWMAFMRLNNNFEKNCRKLATSLDDTSKLQNLDLKTFQTTDI